MHRTPFPFALLLALAGGASPLALSGQIPDPRIEVLVGDVSPERLEEYLTALVGFETRQTMSVGEGDERGIRAAREYMVETLRGFSDRLQVDLDCYTVEPGGRVPEEVELCNVMAVLPGRSARRIYVGGHYDTVARREDGSFDWTRWDNPAPGANDDGSGTALTMEAARVLAQSGLEFDATLVFMGFAGEEQGLLGAGLHAARAVEEGWTIDAMLNNDVVGNVEGGNGIVDGRTVRLFSEDPMDSPSRQLARYVRRHAALYVPGHEVRLIARADRFGRGGDHTAFNREGFPAVRFTESRENYSRQHMAQDTLGGVDFEYLARNTRVNAAVLASLAMAPPAPVVQGERGPMLDRGESGYEARLRWEPSPGAVGYRVVWRETWSPDWQFEREVGDVTELVMPDISIDDYVFGVAAIGPSGHESLVSAYVRPARR
ncbi:MAG TPA: M28 family metallopeptidase [Longimicrobiales bacterium]|nr:M28 family metallopeptidase [Longimicrobiales bacterium]